MSYKKVLEMIRELRHQNDYSQEYMAAKLGITQSTYSRIEQGRKLICTDQLFEILSLLGVDSQVLVNKIARVMEEKLDELRTNYKFN